jgi:hypothetical protein
MQDVEYQSAGVRTVGWRSLREIVVLIVGILAAFALDSWWGARALSSQRSEDIAALLVDFTANRNQLQELVSRQDRVTKAGRALATLGDPSAVPADSLRSLVSVVFSSRRFEPVLGTYHSVLGSGGLNEPSDRELRTALAGFAASIDIRYIEDFADALYLDFINDFPAALSVLFGTTGVSTGRTSLSLDSAFRTSLMLRTSAEAEVGRHYSTLLDRANQILALLEGS